MTSESEKDTVPWIDKTKAKYPYAYDKGGKVARFFGVGGIPHAVLIDPAGKVVWSGHPGQLEGKSIETHLGGALTRPLYTWPAAGKPAAQSLVKGDYAGALAKAAKVPESEGGAELVAAIQDVIESRLKAAEAALAEGNLLGAQEQGAALAKALASLPEHERAQKIADDVAAHPDSKRVLEAQKKIRKLRAKEPSKRKEIEATLKELKQITEEFRGTYVATEASGLMEQLRELLRR